MGEFMDKVIILQVFDSVGYDSFVKFLLATNGKSYTLKKESFIERYGRKVLKKFQDKNK